MIIVALVIGGATLLMLIVALSAGGLGAYFIHKNEEEHQRKVALEEGEARQLAEEKSKIEKLLKEQQAKIDGLLSQLSSVQDEATRRALQKQLEEELERQNKIRAGGGGARPSGGQAKPCNCPAGDPLCSCL